MKIQFNLTADDHNEPGQVGEGKLHEYKGKGDGWIERQIEAGRPFSALKVDETDPTNIKFTTRAAESERKMRMAAAALLADQTYTLNNDLAFFTWKVAVEPMTVTSFDNVIGGLEDYICKSVARVPSEKIFNLSDAVIAPTSDGRLAVMACGTCPYDKNVVAALEKQGFIRKDAEL